MLGVFRCGATAWAREGRLHSWTDLPLADDGRAAVEGDAARLRGARPATIYHPVDEAATETATILAGMLSARKKGVDDLAEPNLGLFEGMLPKELSERHPKRFKQWEDDPLSLVPPEGEPIADARTRLLGAIARLGRKSRAAEIGIVLHPIALAMLKCWFADRPASDLGRTLGEDRDVLRYAVSPAVLDRLLDAEKGATPVSA